MLKTRLITALCGLPFIIAAIWFDTPLQWFTVLAALLALLSFLEFARLVRTSVARVYAVYGTAVSVLFVILRDANLIDSFSDFADVRLINVTLLALAMFPLLWALIVRRKSGDNSWNDACWTVIGIVWMGWTLGHLAAMRGLDDGRNWLFMTLFVIFAFDTSAYFIGRRFGRHKMAPTISPGKTWEGAAGGIIGAILVSLFFTLPTFLQVPTSWINAVIIGIIVSVIGQSGDLLESRFKRYIHVKDSGNTLPGHGGFLDRIDSIVFTGVIVYYYVIWLIQ